MSVENFATQLRATIQRIESQGTDVIACRDLIHYLDDVIQSPPGDLDAARLAQYEAELQQYIEHTKSQNAAQLEMFRSVISSGQNAIRTSFLLNGGAAVALLAFLGHLATSKPNFVALFADVLLPFSIGVLAIAIVSGFTYLSQWFYNSERAWSVKVGFGLNITSIVLGLSSYGAFVWGMVSAAEAFQKFA
ncbi:hypothetical protein S4A8_06628 [Salinisphaera sp. S4-8]|uniref:hypothetical protein n=1 Tax=Salinisphaera sp. S4-8 TaxID=633357 RepID=UPI0033415500